MLHTNDADRNKAYVYISEKIQRCRQEGVVRLDINKARLSKFTIDEVFRATNTLVHEGYFVADYTELTQPYNDGVKTGITYSLRFEWD